MGYTFQEKSGTHGDLVPILHLPWPQFPFRSTDLVGAWLSLVEGEPGGDGVRGWEAGTTGRSELPRRKHRGRSELVAPLLRFLNLSGACRERRRQAPPGPGHWWPVWPPASRDPGGRRLGPRPVPPAGRRGGPTSDSSPAAWQGSVAVRGSAGGSYGPVLSAPPWPAPPACCAWRSCCSGRWAGPVPAPR